MKRAAFLLALLASCSKPPPPNPSALSVKSFKAAVAEYQGLVAKRQKFESASPAPSPKEIDDLDDQATRTRETLKTLLESMGPAAELGLKAKPDDPDCLEAQWVASYFMQEGEKADAALKRLGELKPGDPTILARRAEKLRHAGKYEEARRLIAPELAKNADNPNLLMEDGASAAALNDFETATARLAAAEAKRDRLDVPFLLEFDDLLSDAKEQAKAWDPEKAIRAAEAKANDLPRVRFETSRGPIVLELYENEAPNTVANFIDLVEKQFYDGTKFHRVIPDFMAQGGDPLSRNDTDADDGTGGPGYAIADELPAGKYRHHFRGTLSMANSGPDTGGSQFFLTTRPTAHLDGKHAAFGRVLEGMNVVDALEKGDRLVSAVVLRKRDHAYRPVVKD